MRTIGEEDWSAARDILVENRLAWRFGDWWNDDGKQLASSRPFTISISCVKNVR